MVTARHPGPATASLPAGATKKQVEEAMKGHVLGQGQLMGKYGRS